jgi:putative flippase GtrA
VITATQIFWRYLLFCLLAIIANLGLQAIAHEIVHTPDWFSMGIGTAGGLVLKYILDKNFIFFAEKTTVVRDFKRFVIYTLFGLLTTFLFWSTEWAFIKLWAHPFSRYCGGVIGLSLGYYIKYNLDRKWVFNYSKN